MSSKPTTVDGPRTSSIGRPVIEYDPIRAPGGLRIRLRGDRPVPNALAAIRPIFDTPSSLVASAHINDRSVHPCRAIVDVEKPCFVSYGGVDLNHHEAYDLLIFNNKYMEWVRTFNGLLPDGRVAVMGGFEECGRPLYHSRFNTHVGHIYGKTGEHLGGTSFGWNGRELTYDQGYEVLCWRPEAFVNPDEQSPDKIDPQTKSSF